MMTSQVRVENVCGGGVSSETHTGYRDAGVRVIGPTNDFGVVVTFSKVIDLLE